MKTDRSRRKNLIPFCILLCALYSAGLLADSEEVRYGTGTWDAESYGNHRAVIHVDQRADVPARGCDPDTYPLAPSRSEP